MKHRKLGRTGLQVSELALGGLFVSSHGAAFEQGRAAIHRALELRNRSGKKSRLADKDQWLR